MSEVSTIAHARTADVPAAERFGYFRDALSEVYLGIRTEWAGVGDFDAEFDSIDVGGAVLARMAAPGREAVADCFQINTFLAPGARPP